MAQGHLANGFVEHRPRGVGRHQVLHRRVVVGVGGQQVGDRGGVVAAHAGQHGAVVVVERGPAQRQHKAPGVDQRAVAGLGVAQHRAVAGLAHGQRHVELAFDRNSFCAGGKALPDRFIALAGHPVLRDVGRVDLLNVEVLHVRAGVGEAPGHLRGAAQHHEGQTGQRGANDVECGCGAGRGRLQPGNVPDGGGAQAQVRVVGQQRLAAGGVAAGDHPVVAALAVVETGAVGPVFCPQSHVGRDFQVKSALGLGGVWWQCSCIGSG